MSFESKVGMFVAPIVVALVVALLGIGIDKLFSGSPGEHVEIVSFAVSNTPGSRPAFDIAVRNTGDQVAVLTRAAVNVVDFAALHPCEQIPPTTLFPSGAY